MFGPGTGHSSPRTRWFIERNSRFRYLSLNMRALLILFAVVLTAAAPVFAQVTVDLHALQALPERPTASPALASAAFGRASANPLLPVNTSPNRAEHSPRSQPRNRHRRRRHRNPRCRKTFPQTAAINPIAPPEPPAGSPPPPPPPVSEKAATTAAPTTAGPSPDLRPRAVRPEPRQASILSSN